VFTVGEGVGPDVAIVPFTSGRNRAQSIRRYGRGRHNAELNFGDRCAYALANDTSAPLLFKNDDFSQTDIATAAY
jgi:ribonuclease VapC